MWRKSLKSWIIKLKKKLKYYQISNKINTTEIRKFKYNQKNKSLIKLKYFSNYN